MYISNHGEIEINLPSCTAGCEGSTEGSLGRAVVIVIDVNDSRAASAFVSRATPTVDTGLQKRYGQLSS
jgi:hypothetical protein